MDRHAAPGAPLPGSAAGLAMVLTACSRCSADLEVMPHSVVQQSSTGPLIYLENKGGMVSFVTTYRKRICNEFSPLRPRS